MPTRPRDPATIDRPTSSTFKAQGPSASRGVRLVALRRSVNTANFGRLLSAVVRWVRNQRVGTIGLAVLLGATALAVALAIHGYGTHGLALPSVAAPTASPSPSQPPPSKIKGGAGTSTNTTNATTTTTSPRVKLGPALSKTQYASYAYRIYPGPVSASAQQAMAGYRISTKVSGSTVVIAVSATGSSQALSRKTYAVADNVYFLEANFGDDSGVTELNPGDDGLIVTNPHGLIVEG